MAGSARRCATHGQGVARAWRTPIGRASAQCAAEDRYTRHYRDIVWRQRKKEGTDACRSCTTMVFKMVELCEAIELAPGRREFEGEPGNGNAEVEACVVMAG